jgi:hypothetical protein
MYTAYQQDDSAPAHRLHWQMHPNPAPPARSVTFVLHVLQDCYAMGAAPSSALALAVVPFGPSQFQEAELGDMLEGAVQVIVITC